ncbi:Serine/threonine-protein kinase PRP4 [Chlorella vulgaris]
MHFQHVNLLLPACLISGLLPVESNAGLIVKREVLLAAGSKVDWEAFDETLARVDPCFSDPRFDSLKHVLTVLSSKNPEQEVEELREQRAAVEELVDCVVEGYHAGFNKSIHNYSQILRLFTESKLQLDSLRRSLESSRRRLSAQSRHMVAQYQRGLMLTDTLRLLDDIQGCLAVPSKVQRLEANREWPIAVSLLLDACNKLARQELAAVGALQELAQEMGRRRTGLQASLVAELEARAYRVDPAPTHGGGAAGGGGLDGGGLEGGGGVAGGLPRLALPSFQPRSSSQEGEYSTAAGNLSARGGLPPRPPAAGQLARQPSWGREGPFTSIGSGGGGAAGEHLPSLSSLPRRPSHRRAQTLGGLMPAAAGLTAVDGHLVDTELPLAALVDCVAQLGGLHDAQLALRRHMPRQLRHVISAALDSFPPHQRLPPDEYVREQRRQQQAGGGRASGDDISVPLAVAATAEALLEHVLACCTQVFHQLTHLLRMLSSARVPKASSGLELLLRQQHQQRVQQAAAAGGDPGAAAAAAAAAAPLPPPGPPGAEVFRRELAAAWECLQAECHRLLAGLLNAAAPGAQGVHRGAGEQAEVPLAGWLASVSSQMEAPVPGGTLTFSLEHEVGPLLSRTGGNASGGDAALGSGGGGGGAEEGGDLRARIRAILGGHPGGPALVASLYRPVLSFAEAADRHISSVTGQLGAEPGGRMAALLSMPWRGGAGEGPGSGSAAAGERTLLRSYVESFLRMEFLPAVYVSTRARCSAALEDGDAFKPRTRLRTAYQAGAGAEGRPVLPAALATEQMVEELLGWAAQVPPFATHLTGVVENVLGRVVDAFEAQVAALLGGSSAGRLSESLPLVQLMVKEPAAALLGSPVAFFVGRNTEAMESFVSSVIAAGFGANDEAVECDILRRLMAERPVSAAALLSGTGDVSRLAALAALSDSLEYIADAIHRCTASGASSSSSRADGGGGGAAAGAGSTQLSARRLDRLSTDGGSSNGGSGAATPMGSEARQQQQPQPFGGSSGGGSGPSWQQQLLGSRFKPWRKAGATEAGGLTEGLSHLADRYRAVAGRCVRALRLDMLLLVLLHLQQLPKSSYVCRAEEEAREVDECVAALARLVGRLDEGLEPYQPPHKRAYVFGCLASAAARFVIWMLPDISALNHLGVHRMCRMLASLQPALSGVGGGGGGGGGSFRPDAARQFDRAKLYYTLLTYSAEGLVATVAERPHRFAAPEFLALMAADVAERNVTAEHRQALQRVLTEAGSLAKPTSKANAALQAIAKAIKHFTHPGTPQADDGRKEEKSKHKKSKHKKHKKHKRRRSRTRTGGEDAEEGELPDQRPAGVGDVAGKVAEDVEPRRRSRSRTRSRTRSRSRSSGKRHRSSSAAARADRDRSQGRHRSRSHSRRRDASGPAVPQSPADRAGSRGAGQRERERDSSRLRSRSAGRRRSSRSPPLPDAGRRAAEGRPRSRSPRRDRDGRAPLPSRDWDHRRELNGRDSRRPEYGRDRFGGPPARYDDWRRFDDRRPRSRSRSQGRGRDGRKRSRSRSDERRQRQDSRKDKEEEDEEFQRRVAAALERGGEEDEDRLIEERRRRRQEILAKHQSQQALDQAVAAPTATQQAQQAAAAPAAAEAAAGAQPAVAPAAAAAVATPAVSGGTGTGGGTGEGDGGESDLSDNEEAVVAQLGTTQAGALDIFRHDTAGGGSGDPGPEPSPPASQAVKSGTGEAIGSELDRRLAARGAAAEPDMFAADDDADDIFAATPTDVKQKEAAAAAQAGQAAAAAAGARKGLTDNYDDHEGYYNFQVGEIIGEAGQGQYEVYAAHGRGVFSSVLRARDLARRDHDTGIIPEVAIKVIRANDTMYKAGQMERVILRKLSEADVEGKRHTVRMLGSFEYRNHLCLVFESMDMNLRELTKRYGRGIGLSINAVRVYAQQMLVSLYHLKNCGVLHADIKPDNILVNDRRTVVKLCDFGSAMFSGDNEITPYLVSRFYRAPEVILGLPYEYPMDMWSIGCVVYELFTGHILFPGKTNNEMLKLMMDVKGPFPKKMVKRAEFAFKHFESDPNMSFALLEEDPVTKRPVRRLISNPTVKKDFAALLAGQSPDRRKLVQLVDLLERMMQLDPDRRISPKDALRHPFIREPPSVK